MVENPQLSLRQLRKNALLKINCSDVFQRKLFKPEKHLPASSFILKAKIDQSRSKIETHEKKMDNYLFNCARIEILLPF